MSLYWTLGGNLGINTVGGIIEDLAKKGGAAATALALGAAIAKFIGAVFALAFVRPWGRRLPSQLLTVAGWAVGGFIALYGLANVVAGALVLSGVISAQGANLYALKWHVFFWDAYFVVWGSVLLSAVYGFGRQNKHFAFYAILVSND